VPPDDVETLGIEVQPSRPEPVSLLRLFLMCCKIGLLSFGGGLSGWIYQDVVVRRRWMKEDEFLSGLALCQILPGVNVTNLMVYIGQRLRGALGACVAVIGLLIGPFFAVIGLVLVYERVAGLGWAHAALDGVAAAAIGLLLLIGWKGAQRAARHPPSALILLAIVVTVGLLQWPQVPVALCAAPLSVAFAWMRRPRDA
jgi:chromate transporter